MQYGGIFAKPNSLSMTLFVSQDQFGMLNSLTLMGFVSLRFWDPLFRQLDSPRAIFVPERSTSFFPLSMWLISVPLLYAGFTMDAPGGEFETNNVLARMRKQTLQIAEHFRHFDEFLDSDMLLKAFSLLAPSASGLFLVVTRHVKCPFTHARTFRLCRWAALFRLPPNLANARQANQPPEVRCHYCRSSRRPLDLGGAKAIIPDDRWEREAHVPWFHAFCSRQGFQLFQISVIPLHVFGAPPRIVKIRPPLPSPLGEHDEVDQFRQGTGEASCQSWRTCKVCLSVCACVSWCVDCFGLGLKHLWLFWPRKETPDRNWLALVTISRRDTSWPLRTRTTADFFLRGAGVAVWKQVSASVLVSWSSTTCVVLRSWRNKLNCFNINENSFEIRLSNWLHYY